MQCFLSQHLLCFPLARLASYLRPRLLPPSSPPPSSPPTSILASSILASYLHPHLLPPSSPPPSSPPTSILASMHPRLLPHIILVSISTNFISFMPTYFICTVPKNKLTVSFSTFIGTIYLMSFRVLAFHYIYFHGADVNANVIN